MNITDKCHSTIYRRVSLITGMGDHHILLCKIEQIGLGPTYVEWIENHLHERTQVTKVVHTLSDPAPVSCSIPQGSVLVPLLFIVYINSLPPAMPSGVSTFLYADDIALVTIRICSLYKL